MSQLHIRDEPRSTEEHIAYLADILLREGAIAANEQPKRVTRKCLVQYVADNVPDRAVDIFELFADSWKDEEGEADIEAHAKALELTVSVANEFLTVTFADHNCDLMQWGPAQ